MDKYTRAYPVNAHTRETHSRNRRIHAFNAFNQTAPDAHLGLRFRGGHLQRQRYATLTYFTARNKNINQRSISRSSPHSQTRVTARVARDAHTTFIHPIRSRFLTHTKRHPSRRAAPSPSPSPSPPRARRDAHASPPPLYAHRIHRARSTATAPPADGTHHTDRREQPSRPPRAIASHRPDPRARARRRHATPPHRDDTKKTTKKTRASPRRRHRHDARIDAPSPSAEPIGPLANGVGRRRGTGQESRVGGRRTRAYLMY